MDRRTDGKPGWTLDLQNRDATYREDFDFVAICTGQFNEPQTIDHRGEEAVQGSGRLKSCIRRNTTTLQARGDAKCGARRLEVGHRHRGECGQLGSQ